MEQQHDRRVNPYPDSPAYHRPLGERSRMETTTKGPGLFFFLVSSAVLVAVFVAVIS
jgi:hypothetical protein